MSHLNTTLRRLGEIIEKSREPDARSVYNELCRVLDDLDIGQLEADALCWRHLRDSMRHSLKALE